ncbi:MAG: serine hydrolase domain-containing protein [Gemmatimonadales bacterium]
MRALGLLAWVVLTAGVAHGQAEKIDRYLRNRTTAPFSGVVLIARGDTVLFERAYGFADADLGIALAPEHRLGIGSLTKPITATAILRLIERDALRLDTPIPERIAGVPSAWRSVSVEQLLSHRSGIPDLFGELPAAPADSLGAVVDAALARHVADSIRHPPGTRYAYSNFNYILLGYLLETVGGAGWEEMLAREVLRPAGMTRTEYDDVWRILPGRARGYRRSSGELRHVAYHDHAAYTAGGLLSTARDLLRFDRALTAGRLIGPSLLARMATPSLGDYGLGWQIIRAFGQRQRNHTGGVTGFASHLAHYDDGTVVIVLSNVEDEPVKALACDLAALAFGLAPSARAPACRPER